MKEMIIKRKRNYTGKEWIESDRGKANKKELKARQR